MRTSREACSGWGAVELSFLGATLQVATHAPSTCTDIPTPRGGGRPGATRASSVKPPIRAAESSGRPGRTPGLPRGPSARGVGGARTLDCRGEDRSATAFDALAGRACGRRRWVGCAETSVGWTMRFPSSRCREGWGRPAATLWSRRGWTRPATPQRTRPLVRGPAPVRRRCWHGPHAEHGYPPSRCMLSRTASRQDLRRTGTDVADTREICTGHQPEHAIDLRTASTRQASGCDRAPPVGGRCDGWQTAGSIGPTVPVSR